MAEYWDPHFANTKAEYDALGDELEASLVRVDHKAEREIFNNRCREDPEFAEKMAAQFYKHRHWYDEKE